VEGSSPAKQDGKPRFMEQLLSPSPVDNRHPSSQKDNSSLDKLCKLAERQLSELLESEASRFHCLRRRARLEIATVVDSLAVLIEKGIVGGAV
jgi:hypothetical protein